MGNLAAIQSSIDLCDFLRHDVSSNMVTDMVDSQITAVRNVVAQAYKDGLTRPQTSNRLIQLLNDMPAPRGTPAGLAGAANIFGDATRGLTNRYAMAVYNRCQKIMEQNPTMTPRQLKKYADTYGTKLRNSRAPHNRTHRNDARLQSRTPEWA